jgi:hypothetical protein
MCEYLSNNFRLNELSLLLMNVENQWGKALLNLLENQEHRWLYDDVQKDAFS